MMAEDVMLKDGESVEFEDIPVGTLYRIVEDDYSEENFVTTSRGATGTIVAGTSEAIYTNTFNKEIPSPEEPPEEPSSELPEEPPQERPKEIPNQTSTDENDFSETVQTGDRSRSLRLVLMMMASINVILIIVSRRYRNTKPAPK